MGSFDIAIIGADHLARYDESIPECKHWENDPFWSQDVRVALEIKYCILGNDFKRVKVQFKKDIDKLNKYLAEQKKDNKQYLGIAILFVQAESLFPSSTAFTQPPGEQPSNGVLGYVVTPKQFLLLND